MRQRILVFCLLITVLLITGFAGAQQPKVARIGYLTVAGSPPYQAFLQGLHDLAYVEGQNIAILYRSADGKSERLADLAEELVRLKVDILVADGTSPSLEAKKATSTIPIVMMSSTDPIGNGLVASLAQPRGNVTGVDEPYPDSWVVSCWSCSRRSCRHSAVWRS